MVMILHRYIRMDPYRIALMHFAKQFQKMPVIPIVVKYRLPIKGVVIKNNTLGMIKAALTQFEDFGYEYYN